PGRHRHPRDAAGGNPDGHRQAGAPGRGDLRPEDPRSAGRRPRVREQARRPVPDGHPPDLADAGLPVQAHVRADRGRRGRRPGRGELDRLGPLDPGRDRRAGAVRGHHRGVARRGRRPGLPRTATGPLAPRGRDGVTATAKDISWEMPTGSPHATILGLGAHRATRIVPNSEVIDAIDSSDEWIQQRSGIKERRWVGPEESLETMALAACQQALANAEIDPAQIDAIVVATCTHTLQTPALAAKLAHLL